MRPVTIYGVVVLVLMMAAYALERRGRGYVLAFAVGCALSSSYGFLSGAWPFGAVEAVWCLVALRRYRSLPGAHAPEVRRGRGVVPPGDGSTR